MSLQDNFRKAMRSYVYSVSILSNVSENKEYNAITVSSVTSVSICVRVQGRLVGLIRTY